MIPAAVTAGLQRGLRDWGQARFEAADPGFRAAITALFNAPAAVDKGPYLQLGLPFVAGSRPDFFAHLPYPYTPHAHQEAAWMRIGAGRSTLVATGTGSGKTECFLWPLLAQAALAPAQGGIQAILIYPMNALAADQALRIAQLIHQTPALRGRVRAGLYVGDDGKAASHAEMGPTHLITDRDRLRAEPPHLLLTNYKMLDFLLMRPLDRGLWQGAADSLTALVVDELHTFDGAQGTDLACLLRRLRLRLGLGRGRLCCVGTSATLGGPEGAARVRSYAEQIFGEDFDESSVITEQRQSPAAVFAGRPLRYMGAPSGPAAALDPTAEGDPERWLAGQVERWLGEARLGAPPPAGTAARGAWQVALGEALLSHGLVRGLVTAVGGQTAPMPAVVAGLRQAGLLPGPGADEDLGPMQIVSLLGLISEARRRVGGRLGPLFTVRTQLWQKELRRVVATLGPAPEVAASDTLGSAEAGRRLPVVHCRSCGLMGWATLEDRAAPERLAVEPADLYEAFFRESPRVRFLLPPTGAAARLGEAVAVDPVGMVRRFDEQPRADEVALRWVVHTRRVKGRERLSRDCPACERRAGLLLVGARGATLAALATEQLFTSRYNRDKKLLIFNDAVQDTTHRAGFLMARTWRSTVRMAVAGALRAHTTAPTLLELADGAGPFWQHALGREETFVAALLAPELGWMRDFEALKSQGEVGRTQTPPQVPRLAPGNHLSHHVTRRLAYEVVAELSGGAREAGSMTRAGLAVLAPEPALVQEAVEALWQRLPDEEPQLRGVARARVEALVEGALQLLIEQGGVLLNDIPHPYWASGGDAFHFSHKGLRRSGRLYLPRMGPGSRLPALFAQRPGCEGFPGLVSGRAGTSSRLEDLYRRTLLPASTLALDPGRPLIRLMEELKRAGILDERDVAKPLTRAWGLRPEALRVERSVAELRCGDCGVVRNVAAARGSAWAGRPCLTAGCRGALEVAPVSPAGWLGRLLEQGSLERVFAEEHTGLLPRDWREKVERSFKAEVGAGRLPWDTNLLCSTPTLEMGIDIGDLSAAMLLGVPPTVAGALQRIGRAGRRDGNAVVLTIANTRPRDLYFYAEPLDMIGGVVEPPGVFLGASAVLERQLRASVIDRWARRPTTPVPGIPPTVQDLLRGLAAEGIGATFLRGLAQEVEGHEEEVLGAFLAHFPGQIDEDGVAWLRAALASDPNSPYGQASGLMGKIIAALHREAQRIDALQRQRKQVQATRKRVAEEPADDARDELLLLLDREIDSLRARIERARSRDTLGFLTEEGLLPNYAFPDAPVVLESYIYGEKQDQSAAREAMKLEWVRPAERALVELAPGAEFYAGGRKVLVDQADVQQCQIERWRLCASCAYLCPEPAEGTTLTRCPACSDGLWQDAGRLFSVMRQKRMFSTMPDWDTRVGDASDDRDPPRAERALHLVPNAAAQGDAWAFDPRDGTFAWDHLREAELFSLNLGRKGAETDQRRIAGLDRSAAGFDLCEGCGMTPDREREGVHQGRHKPWCVHFRRQRDAQLALGEVAGPPAEAAALAGVVRQVLLLRSFESEVLRMLAPVAPERWEEGSAGVSGSALTALASFEAAVRMGLQIEFGGRLDHLRTTRSDEPMDGAWGRRSFVVIYDTVPGGTGYIRELARHPEKVLGLLAKAYARLAACPCGQPGAASHQRDGCHRCILGFAPPEGVPSRLAAMEMLAPVTRTLHPLRRVASIGDVRLETLTDSALEDDFLAVLGSHGILQPGRVGEGLGRRWTWTVGGRRWTLRHGVLGNQIPRVSEELSVDFLFTRDDPGARPVAVFLDGWAYHRGRVGADLLQRMELLRVGVDTWTFTWDDVQAALGNRSARPGPILLGEPLQAGLLRFFPEAPALHRLRDEPEVTRFVSLMRGDVSPAEEQRLAWMSLLTLPMTKAGSPAHSRFRAQAAGLGRVAGGILLGQDASVYAIKEASPEVPLGVAVALGATAAARATRLPGGPVTTPVAGDHTVLLRFDADPEVTPDELTRAQAWRAGLRLFNRLRVLPGLWAVSVRSPADLDAHAQLRALAAAPDDEDAGLSPAWTEALTALTELVSAAQAEGPGEAAWGPPLVDLLRALAAEGFSPPAVGDDVPLDPAAGRLTLGWLVWAEHRVAVVAEVADDPAWTLLPCAGTDLPTRLRHALSPRAAS
jgi:DEAD/DEAH box helicase domain-containing protein